MRRRKGGHRKGGLGRAMLEAPVGEPHGAVASGACCTLVVSIGTAAVSS